jgi:hypothetical protein
MKRYSDQPSQSHYYFHIYLKQKQKQKDYAIRAAKRTENALGNFMKLSSLPDESTYLITTTSKEIKPLQPHLIKKAHHTKN